MAVRQRVKLLTLSKSMTLTCSAYTIANSVFNTRFVLQYLSIIVLQRYTIQYGPRNTVVVMGVDVLQTYYWVVIYSSFGATTHCIRRSQISRGFDWKYLPDRKHACDRLDNLERRVLRL